MPIEFRKLRPGDESACRAFRIHALTRYPASFTSTSAEAEACSLDWYAKRIAKPGDPGHFLIGAFDGERLIGTVGLASEERASERHKATLYGMAMHEAYSGRGIGRQLLRELIKEARAIHRLKQIVLSVTEGNNAAVNLYQSCGFETYGCEPRATFIGGIFHDKLLMMLRLD